MADGTKRRKMSSGSIYQRGDRPGWVASIRVRNLRGESRRKTRNAATREGALEALRALQTAELLKPPAPIYIPPPPPMPSTIGTVAPRVPIKLDREFRKRAADLGWLIRSVPEARVAIYLSRFGIGPAEIKTQVKMGRFHLDFAAMDVKVAIEVDGPMHRLPENAAKDLERDLWLGNDGWIVFRVDGYGEEVSLQERLVRIVRFIKCERLSA